MKEWFEEKIRKQRKDDFILFIICFVIIITAGLLRVH